MKVAVVAVLALLALSAVAVTASAVQEEDEDVVEDGVEDVVGDTAAAGDDAVLSAEEEAELEAFSFAQLGDEEAEEEVEDEDEDEVDEDEEAEAEEELALIEGEGASDATDIDADTTTNGELVTADVKQDTPAGGPAGPANTAQKPTTPAVPLPPGYALFSKTLLAYLEKYKNAVEGAKDGKFKELFGDLTAIRKASPMFTTCTSFVPKVLQAAQRAANWRLPKDPSAVFFSMDWERRKKGIKSSYFYAGLPPVANSWQKYKTFDQWVAADKTAVYVALDKAGAPRPQPGDVFLLGFAAKHPTSKLLTTGMFSHIGFVTKVEPRLDPKTKKPTGIEDWTVVAGGGGNAKAKQEAVTESKMEVNTLGTHDHPIMVGKPTDPVKRYLAGWIPMLQLYKDGKAGFK